MAPQQPTAPVDRNQIRRRAAPPPPTLTQADRDDNSNAVIGSAQDDLDEGGTLEPNQSQRRDDGDNDGLTRREAIGRSPQDDARSQIAARFRRAEPEQERPFNGDMSDPENIYGEFGRDDDANLTDDEIDRRAAERERQGTQPARTPKPTTFTEDVGAEDDDQIDPDLIDDQRQTQRRQRPADQPRMITRKVRGKDVTLSEDEWMDRATQVTAAESYMEEARGLLADAKKVRDTRAVPDRQHPDDQSGEHQDDLGNDPAEGEVQHPEPTFRDVVQKIQFGDPEEAATELERLIEARTKKTARTVSDETQVKRAYDQDYARSQKALKAFTDANPDLAGDEIASIAIERGMYSLYKEDILALGIEENKLPTNPRDLANWHRFYRMNGYEVRGTSTLLNESKARFQEYMGGRREPQRQRQSRQEQPDIRVNVSRDDRRMAIPNQPTRAVAPRRDAQPAQRSSGSDVVARMRQQRGQA